MFTQITNNPALQKVTTVVWTKPNWYCISEE